MNDGKKQNEIILLTFGVNANAMSSLHIHFIILHGNRRIKQNFEYDKKIEDKKNWNNSDLLKMRQLKGKVRPETRKEKRERKQENLKVKQQICTVVLPTVIGLVLLLAAYIYIRAKPVTLSAA